MSNLNFTVDNFIFMFLLFWLTFSEIILLNFLVSIPKKLKGYL